MHGTPASLTSPRSRTCHPALLGLAMVLVGLNMRPALSTVGPVLPELVRDVGISATMASTLTTLPVLCLGIFGLIAPASARRLGSERTVLLALVVLAAGIALRILPDVFAQLVAAILAGAGIGVMGAVLPAVIKRDFPGSTALMTGVYAMALCAGAAAGAGATLPLADLFAGFDAYGRSWALALAFWSLPAVAAMVAWGLLVPNMPSTARQREVRPVRGLWRDGLAWQVTLFMGLQSSLAYIVLAWLVVILRERGVEPVMAGLVVSCSVMVQVFSSLAAPVAARRLRRQSGPAVALLACTMAGMLGCMVAPLWSLWGWALLLGIGQGGCFALALLIIVLRSPNPDVATQLSSMAQSVGYALAAAGPMLMGVLHDLSGGWTEAAVLVVVLSLAAALFGFGAGRDRHVLEPQVSKR